MAANNLLEMTRSLRLYVPQLPITLAEQFIRDRYRQIIERRDWSGMRKEAEFQLKVAKNDGLVAVTFGSATVTGTATTFALTDIGRQFKVGSSPVYTISSVDVAQQILTLDREFGSTTNSVSGYYVFDAYVTPPADFLRFMQIVDKQAGYQLRHWITAAELDAMDPQRLSYGQPYLIVDRLYSSAGLPQFEAWPYSTTQRSLYYTYVKRATDLITDTDVPIWPLRSDVIVQGALADVARWPGTADKPNPYFARPEFWKSYEQRFEDLMIELERRDDDVYNNSLIQASFGLAPMSASFMQNHVNF